ncbi:MAG TPA: Mut7-C RNAse domain-containing protein [Azonexus sp.]|nr:Mut7-C RNAse domain-containing protein [Azonexus sp.]
MASNRPRPNLRLRSSASGLEPLNLTTATFRFYAELNDFLAPARRGQAFAVKCAPTSTTKHMIEALGVPHTEVELILINGESAGFDQRLRDGDRLSIFPAFRSFKPTTLQRVRELPQRIQFVADAHLGALARRLRMAGFNTLYRNDYEDREIAEIAERENRIVLTRDRDLLKHRVIIHGCYIHAMKPPQQFYEVMRRLNLTLQQQPFTLCIVCNLPLRQVTKEAVVANLPLSVRSNPNYEKFTTCDCCGRIYWKGSHWQRMAALFNDSTLTRKC